MARRVLDTRIWNLFVGASLVAGCGVNRSFSGDVGETGWGDWGDGDGDGEDVGDSGDSGDSDGSGGSSSSSSGSSTATGSSGTATSGYYDTGYADGYWDTGYYDTGYYDTGYADGYYDTGYYDTGYYDTGYSDDGYGTSYGTSYGDDGYGDDGYQPECTTVDGCGTGRVCGPEQTCLDTFVTFETCEDGPSLVPSITIAEDNALNLRFADALGSDGRDELLVRRDTGLFLYPGLDQAPQTLLADEDVRNFDVGDVDGDGVPDIAFTRITSGGNIVGILQGDGNGGFTEFSVGQIDTDLWNWSTVEIGDFDGQPGNEIVVGVWDQLRVYDWSPQDGGSVVAAAGFDGNSRRMEMGDLGGGPGEEVLVSSTYRAYLAESSGNGMSVAESWWRRGDDGPLEMDIGEVDGESGVDVVLSMSAPGHTLLAVVDGGLDGVPDRWFSVPQSTQGQALWDTTGDGVHDVVLGMTVYEGVWLHREPGQLIPCMIKLPVIADRVVTGDPDGDGRQELALSDGGTVWVFEAP